MQSSQPWNKGQNVTMSMCKNAWWKAHRAGLLPVMPRGRTKGNRHRLKYREFCSNMSLSYSEGGQTLEQVTREALGSPSLEIFKTQLDKDLSNLLCFMLYWFTAGIFYNVRPFAINCAALTLNGPLSKQGEYLIEKARAYSSLWSTGVCAYVPYIKALCFRSLERKERKNKNNSKMSCGMM